MEDLTLKEEKFLTALMLAPTVGEACEKVGISRRTAQRYMAKTTVRSAYRKMRSQAMEQATSRLNSVAVDAVEVLTAIMNDPTISRMHGNNQQELFLSLPIKLMKMKQL